MYELEWNETATREILRAASSADPGVQRSVLAAVTDIDRVLTRAPVVAGESREPGIRVVISDPLAITYRLNVRLKRVFIIAVRIRRPTT